MNNKLKLVVLLLLNIAAIYHCSYSISVEKLKEQNVGISLDKLIENKLIENSFSISEPSESYTFEFKNKTNNKVYLSVIQGKKIVKDYEVAASQGSKESQHGYIRLNKKVFDPKKETIIWLSSFQDQWPAVLCNIKPSKKGNTVYLTYEDSKIRPQKGKSGKTQTGLSLKNNISDKQIICGAPVSNVVGQYEIEETPQSKTNFPIEFKNKTNVPYSIRLEYDNQKKEESITYSRGSKETDHGYLRINGIDPTEKLMITFISHNVPVAKYEIDRNFFRKAIYVTIEMDKKGNPVIRPQKGTGILSKKAQSGMSLESNVQEKEIKVVQ